MCVSAIVHPVAVCYTFSMRVNYSLTPLNYESETQLVWDIFEYAAPLYVRTRDYRHNHTHIARLIQTYLTTKHTSSRVRSLNSARILSIILLHDIWQARRSLQKESTTYLLNALIDGIGSFWMARKLLQHVPAPIKRPILNGVLHHGSFLRILPSSSLTTPYSEEGKFVQDSDTIEFLTWARAQHSIPHIHSFNETLKIGNVFAVWFYLRLSLKNFSPHSLHFEELAPRLRSFKREFKIKVAHFLNTTLLPKTMMQKNAFFIKLSFKLTQVIRRIEQM